MVKQDYDFFLMSLYWRRFVCRDDSCFVAKHCTNAGDIADHRIKIMQQKIGKHVVGTMKDKPWKVVIKKL